MSANLKLGTKVLNPWPNKISILQDYSTALRAYLLQANEHCMLEFNIQ